MESWLAEKFCTRCEVAFLPPTNDLSCDRTVRKHCPHRLSSPSPHQPRSWCWLCNHRESRLLPMSYLLSQASVLWTTVAALAPAITAPFQMRADKRIGLKEGLSLSFEVTICKLRTLFMLTPYCPPHSQMVPLSFRGSWEM